MSTATKQNRFSTIIYAPINDLFIDTDYTEIQIKENIRMSTSPRVLG